MNIKKKLEFWKKKLLDLGKRNRLIHSPYPKSEKRVSRSNLLFLEPDIERLWDDIVERGRTIEFSYVNADSEEELSEDTVMTDNCFPNGVRTNQNIPDTCKTLTSMMKKAREFTENKGLNALYLSFGFLYWKEHGGKGAEMRSPLLLVPVALTQDSITEPISLSAVDDDILVNQALLQKMYMEFGLQFPEFTDDQKPSEYFSLVQDVCKPFSWSVRGDEVQLSMFSFLKMAMYHDIENNTEKITNHPVIRALNGDLQGLNALDVDLQDISHFDHDSVEPQKVFSVLDADSSQQDAILLAKKGVSFVLQGPPGTGKSQTITNMIAELIGEGKKVLFVSEKMAALQVVFHRLQQCGLGKFCLTLHDPNAKRKDILNQLCDSMQLAKSKVMLQDEAFSQLHHLGELRSQLNQYAKDLHTPVAPLGKTIFEVNGKLAKLADIPNIRYIQPDAGEFTEEQFLNCESVLKEFTRIVKESGYQKENPWNGCLIRSITYEFRQSFLVNAEALIQLLTEGETISNTLFQKIGDHNYSGALSELQAFLDFCILSANSPGIPVLWVYLPLEIPYQNSQNCAGKLKEYAAFSSFLDSFTKTGNALIGAASSLMQAANENSETIPGEILSAYENAQYSYITCFTSSETDPISEQVRQFRNSIEQCREQAAAYKQKTNACEEKENQLSEAAKRLDSEQEILNEKQEHLEAVRNIVLEDFREEILTIDVNALLQRYQGQYHSLFRFLNGQYRRDRKMLKSYSIEKTKMSYAQAIAILDKVSVAQQAQRDTDKQAARTAEMLSVKNQRSEELSECREQQTIAQQDLEKAVKATHTCLSTLCDDYTKARNSYQKKAASLHDEINRMLTELQDALQIPVTEKTDISELTKKIKWAAAFQDSVKKYDIQEDFAEAICSVSPLTASIRRNAEKLQEWLDRALTEVPVFTDLFSEEYREKFMNLPLTELRSCVQKCKEQFSALEHLIDYRNVKKAAEEAGFGDYFAEAVRCELEAEAIIPVFEKCFYRSWLDAVIHQFSSIETFRGQRQDEKIADFRRLDKLSMQISEAALQAKIISEIPNFDTVSVGGSEVALLRREMAKKRKLMPLRKLIAGIPSLLPSLKPCILMSPLSVSTYFGDSDYEFDTVIFDEASQVRTEDAICSIFRAKQVIIAGDSKQLPPTDFFSASVSESDFYEETEEGEADDTGTYESLLDEASVLPTQTLLWHYRSKHEDLIAFSNLKIYGGNLVTFPSAVEKSEDMGVSYVYVKDGIYERTGAKGNRKEAEIIADMVFDHFRNHPDRSIGIIAFGEVQQSMIESVITKRRQDDLTYEDFFSMEREEPLFIKNLETVQGDERDTIIFSIGYAKDANGIFRMNFGPLSRNGGERRLNVAVTRARYQLKLVGSILPTDINVDKISGNGPKLLRDYIDFAIRGADALLTETKEQETVWLDSPFEESVYNLITANGYDVRTQVGCSGYRIDMAVRHPGHSGRFVLAIECDGASYHSARTARERDRLRQTILENMGWKFYRIWSTDWIKDPDTEGKKLLSAISQAIAEYQEPEIIPEETEHTDFLKISRRTKADLKKEDITQFRSPHFGKNVKEIPIADIEKTMLKMLEHGYGYTKEGLFDDIAKYGYGWKRKGKTIVGALTQAYDHLLSNGSIMEENGRIKALAHV